MWRLAGLSLVSTSSNLQTLPAAYQAQHGRHVPRSSQKGSQVGPMFALAYESYSAQCVPLGFFGGKGRPQCCLSEQVTECLPDICTVQCTDLGSTSQAAQMTGRCLDRHAVHFLGVNP